METIGRLVTDPADRTADEGACMRWRRSWHRPAAPPAIECGEGIASALARWKTRLPAVPAIIRRLEGSDRIHSADVPATGATGIEATLEQKSLLGPCHRRQELCRVRRIDRLEGGWAVEGAPGSVSTHRGFPVQKGAEKAEDGYRQRPAIDLPLEETGANEARSDSLAGEPVTVAEQILDS